MRFVYFVVLAVLLASCERMLIKNSDYEQAGINAPYIRTTNIDVDKKIENISIEPKIDITSPKNGEVINDSKILVRLNISNFKLVTPDKYPKKGQGHVQVWLDDMEFRGSKTDFVFENESNGMHTIKAELMLSNNSVLPYSQTIKIVINKT